MAKLPLLVAVNIVPFRIIRRKKMVTLSLQIAALLVAVTGTFASEYPCTISSKRLDCSSRGLTAPPAGFWPNYTEIYLEDNPITAFAKNAFTGFPDVDYVFIVMNHITEIDLGDFVVMPKLKSLTLQRNNIKTIIPAPKGTNFAKLEQLLLLGNLITTLDPAFLFNAPNMNRLSLKSNPLVVKNGEPVVNHNSLQTIQLGPGSNFADLDIAALLSGVPNVTFISLMSSELTDVTGAFVNFKKLTTVKLDYNSITQLTSNTFATEGVLDSLSLVGNPLTRLDTAAVNTAMKRKGWIDVTDTPLACNCLYEGLYWWAEAREITIYALCGGENLCGFTRRRSPASPAQYHG